MKNEKDTKHNPDANPDPITGQPGAHPVGTGVGAGGVGAVTTAVGGAVGGPIGAAVGAVVGAVAGGLAGKAIAEQIDPTIEDAYWRENYRTRSYVKSDYDYDRDYSPAYRTGYTGYSNYSKENLSYTDAEPRLKSDYEKHRGNSRLSWDQAKHATQDAWNRLDSSVRGRHEHDAYWRDNYKSRPYIEADRDYSYYQPAYDTGYAGYTMYGMDNNMTYEQAEPQLRSEYERHHGSSGLGWDQAKHAVKDAWNRVKNTFSDSSDHSRRRDY